MNMNQQRLEQLERQGNEIADLTRTLRNLMIVEDIPEIIQDTSHILVGHIGGLFSNVFELRDSYMRATRANHRSRTASERPIRQPRKKQPRPKKQKPTTVFVISDRITLRKIMSDACGICLDNNTRRKTITTSCGHNYCKCCFSGWSKHKLTSQTIVSCPECRGDVLEITEYRGPPRVRRTPTTENV
jgi:hypothetical protein